MLLSFTLWYYWQYAVSPHSYSTSQFTLSLILGCVTPALCQPVSCRQSKTNTFVPLQLAKSKKSILPHTVYTVYPFNIQQYIKKTLFLNAKHMTWFWHMHMLFKVKITWLNWYLTLWRAVICVRQLANIKMKQKTIASLRAHAAFGVWR